MTLPPNVRIFFAIDLSVTLKEQIGRYIGSLKKRAKSNDIRWTRKDNLHITLHFLAEVQTAHLPMLIQNVKKEIENEMIATSLTVGKVQLFPNPFRPRVIVLDISPQDELAALAAKVGNGIQSTQYELEHRPFKAHLTIGRIKHAQKVNLSFLAEFKAPEAEPISVEEVVLFRSEPLPEGSTYTVLEKIKLNTPVVPRLDRGIHRG